MQLLTFPPRWDDYPNHRHDATVEDANQAEVYIPLERSALMHADGDVFELRPGMMVPVGPEQLLPPKQRVTVVLRDALGWPANEVAEHLDDSVPAITSALQRGRERLRRERGEGTLARRHEPVDSAAEDWVMRRFQEAWAAVDIPGFPGRPDLFARPGLPTELASGEGAD
mgnify:FL=1